VPELTALDQANALIEKTWGHPIDELEALAVRRPTDDPFLTAAMHIRSALVVSNNAITVHQNRLHALTRPGHVPPFYDLERTTRSAMELRIAQPKVSWRSGNQLPDRRPRGRGNRGARAEEPAGPGCRRPLN
jgi:hypothetical protein